MNKQYQYNGKTYRLKPLTLGIMRGIMPALVKLKKLVYKYTSDIDMTEVNKNRQKIAELEKAREQLNIQLEDEIQNDERIKIINRINSLAEKAALYKTELENDRNLSGKIRLYNECSSMAVMELFSEAELVGAAVAAILEGDPHIDINNPDAVKFISEVLTDFFLLIKTASAVSAA